MKQLTPLQVSICLDKSFKFEAVPGAQTKHIVEGDVYTYSHLPQTLRFDVSDGVESSIVATVVEMSTKEGSIRHNYIKLEVFSKEEQYFGFQLGLT